MCEFNSAALLDLRRYVSSDPDVPLEYACRVIKQIDKERWKHFEETGCSCWDDAIEAASKQARTAA